MEFRSRVQPILQILLQTGNSFHRLTSKMVKICLEDVSTKYHDVFCPMLERCSNTLTHAHTQTHIHAPTYKLIYILPIYQNTYISNYRSTYIYAYINTSIHLYIYTYAPTNLSKRLEILGFTEKEQKKLTKKSLHPICCTYSWVYASTVQPSHQLNYILKKTRNSCWFVSNQLDLDWSGLISRHQLVEAPGMP